MVCELKEQVKSKEQLLEEVKTQLEGRRKLESSKKIFVLKLEIKYVETQ